jgi:hypothetical protein
MVLNYDPTKCNKLIDVVKGFLKRKKTIGELRSAVKEIETDTNNTHPRAGEKGKDHE